MIVNFNCSTRAKNEMYYIGYEADINISKELGLVLISQGFAAKRLKIAHSIY